MLADYEYNDIPLVVDLDGTLIRSDLLYDSIFDAISRDPRVVLDRSLRGDLSKQGIKQFFADRAEIDYARLPYNEDVLARLMAAKDEGRPVYLATASNERHAQGVADHLGIFNGVFASTNTHNLRGAAKADALLTAFGDGGFDYIANGNEDLAVWRHARKAISVGLSRDATDALDEMHPQREEIAHQGVSFKSILKLLRVHQYAKNMLIFVPVLTSHQLTPENLFYGLLAFLSFSACASGVYILNDLVDIQADRAHPTKKNRPFAAGKVPVTLGLALFPALLVLSFGLALAVSPAFTGVLALYFALTTAYSFSLKRKMMVDVVVLAMLYTVRVVAGSAAVGIAMSEWLFAFAMLIFTSLALIKRYIELSVRLDEGLPDPSNRNYRIGDLQIIAALAAAAGMNAITILALYVSSENVVALYSRPYILWGLCPLLLYWTARMLMMAHRRMVDDDPIVFAIRDRRSWAVAVACMAVVAGAV